MSIFEVGLLPGGLDPAVELRDDIWRPIVDSLKARVALLDDRGVIVAVNESWRRHAGQSGPDANHVGCRYQPNSEISSDATLREVAVGLRRVSDGEIGVFEIVYDGACASRRAWYRLRAVPYAGGKPGWLVVSHQDVTEERYDRERAYQQAAVLDEIDAAIHTTDLDRIVLTWNHGAERLYGWTAREAIGRRTDELMLAGAPLNPTIRGEISSGAWEGELELARKDGSTFPAYTRTSITRDLEDAPVCITYIAIDISERLETQRKLKVARDNLRAVTDSIGEGMFTIDLDSRVTYMNPAAQQALGWSLDDGQGGVFQDLIWCHRLENEVVRVEDDVFCRADGLELPVSYTASPILIDGVVEGFVVVFQDITERKAQNRRLEQEAEKVAWIKRIRDAIAADDLVLLAQPIVDLGRNEVVQRELLIRMRDHDDRDKLISPANFLPVAEEFGLIGEIDRWVIDQAVRIAATGTAVELNVSAASISDRHLVPYIESAISRSGADPTILVFEITETAIVRNEEDGRRFVERMHALGCKVALDDFGTGYGGFTYLKQLPVDYLKIDIEFVRDLDTNVASRNVVEAIVTLAQRFGLGTVAEGVERAEVIELLEELGVDYAQGYHLGRPAPVTLS